MSGFVTWKCGSCGVSGLGETLPPEHPLRCVKPSSSGAGFTDEEVSDAINRTRGLPYSLHSSTVRRIMEKTAELLAARAGTLDEARRNADCVRAKFARYHQPSGDQYGGIYIINGVRMDPYDALRRLEEMASLSALAVDRAGEAKDRITALEAHVSELERSLENARRERDEAVATGKQFHQDARKHYDQSCTNLQRAERAERDSAALLERVKRLEGASKEPIESSAAGRAQGHMEALQWLREHHGGVLRPTAADLESHLMGLRAGYKPSDH